MIQIQFKCDTNTLQIDKSMQESGRAGEKLVQYVPRLAQYPQIKSSIYKLSLEESRKRKFNIISVNTCLKLN